MKRRVASLMLIAAMASSLLAGTECTAASEDELTKIYWQWPCVDVCDGLDDVEAQFNQMLAEEGIPAEVEFVPCGLNESQREAQLMVSAGEQLDIMLTAFTGIDNLVSSNLILPLDDLIEEYGQDIIANSHTLTKCKYNGALYGICTGDKDYSGGTYCVKTEYLEKYGIEIDEEAFYTIDDVENIMKTICDGEGGNVFGMVPWAGTNEPGNYAYFALGKPSGSMSAGVINFSVQGYDDPTIVNLFETDAYREYAERMYQWAQAGYIAADAAITTEAPNDIIARDDCFGWFYWGDIGVAAEMGTWLPADFTQVNIQEYYRTGLGNASVMWNIPVTTADAGLAVQVLNYIYKNVDAATLLQRGREGIEYTISQQEENGFISQITMASEEQSSLEYYQPYGIYGNTLDWPAMAPSTRELTEQKQALDESLDSNHIFCGSGYVFVSDNVSAEISAVETVMSQYCMTINCGAADPDVVLPEFIEALKAAGIDTVIAENQRQLDEYMASLN